MSKVLGWIITIILWWIISFSASLICGGFDNMPVWVYILIVFLCLIVKSIINVFVKKKEPEDDNKEQDKNEGENEK